MNIYLTEVRAVDPDDGLVKIWTGPRVRAISAQVVRSYLVAAGMGFLTITGRVQADMDASTDAVKYYDRGNLN